MLGGQFVFGRTIDEAIANAREPESRGYRYSYDMLGEAARTAADAERYFEAYAAAIARLAPHCTAKAVRDNPGISVKLSALHPRYEFIEARARAEGAGRRARSRLAVAARNANMGFNIDAEEADRLDLSLDVIAAVLADPALAGWDGFGVVVQAYGKRAAAAASTGSMRWPKSIDRRIMVRLVKGAYWDAEIKRAQALGLDGFPVFTRKAATDVSYIAAARKPARRSRSHLSAVRDPQRAHRGRRAAPRARSGEGTSRPSSSSASTAWARACTRCCARPRRRRTRIYAPVGAPQGSARLPRPPAARERRQRLVRLPDRRRGHSRREGGRGPDRAGPRARRPDRQSRDPPPAGALRPVARKLAGLRHHRSRRRSPRLEQASGSLPRDALDRRAADRRRQRRHSRRSLSPTRRRPNVVGTVASASHARRRDRDRGRAAQRSPRWSARPVAERAALLRKVADLYEANRPELFALLAREAGKTLADAVAEVREAVDFLRYYAAEATDERRRRAASSPASRPGIFRSPSSPARSRPSLVAGNTVLAKPAPQTPLIACRAVAADARGRHPRRRDPAPAGRRPDGRRRAHLRPPHRRRRLHRLAPHRKADRPRDGRPPRARRGADRRDRRAQRHDRRLDRAARAGGARHRRPRPSRAPASAARRSASSTSRKTPPSAPSRC